ncbi:hypothetical protein JMJ77_0001195 [Colletotrichum scovillei]|uniref:Uncharacterized protein n=1 Tax=Colletotrichum scovillei TaxID=1209932 RepID=A0A9P7RBL3_9PEZI|nr:hypothetical protein JMJ77_0001195 [Colletotrichum scovillei]KAG7072421.1 hypothetical protein JMJ76_0005271 [Colletotrichum scovillei]KAG7080638.1 hypothetical protein JMJ78_0007724 [Colletotrichum scovillei]
MSHQTQIKPNLRVTETQNHVRASNDPFYYLRTNPVRLALQGQQTGEQPARGGTSRIARGERIAGADTYQQEPGRRAKSRRAPRLRSRFSEWLDDSVSTLFNGMS